MLRESKGNETPADPSPGLMTTSANSVSSRVARAIPTVAAANPGYWPAGVAVLTVGSQTVPTVGVPRLNDVILSQ